MLLERGLNMIDTKQVAELLKVHPNTVYKYTEEGMPSYKLGNNLRYEKEEVMKWIKENKKKYGRT